MSNAIETVMSLVDQVTPGLQKIRDQLKQTQQEANQTSGSLNNVGQAGQGSGNNLGSMVPKLRGLAFGIAGVVAAAGAATMALNEMGRAGIEFGDEIGDVAGKAGIAAEELQRLRLTAEMNGGSFEAVDKSLLKFNQTLGQAQQGIGPLAKVVEELGVNVRNADGSFKTANQVFNEVGAAIGKLENDAQKTAYAMQIFGKSGQQLIEMFGMTDDAVKQADETIRKYGGYMSQEMVDSASAAKDELAAIDQGTATLVNKLNVAIGLPVAVWWAQISNETANAAFQLAKYLGLVSRFEGMFYGAFNDVSTENLEKELAAREEDIKSLTEQLRRTKAEWNDKFGWASPVVEAVRDAGDQLWNFEWGRKFQSEVQQLEDRIDQYKQATAEMRRTLQSRVGTEVPSESSFAGLQWLEKYRQELKRSEAQALSDKKAQAQALLQVELDRLDAEYQAAITSNQLSNDKILEAEQILEARKVAARRRTANEIATIENQLADLNKRNREKELADQKRADMQRFDRLIREEEAEQRKKDAFDAILAKFNEQATKQDAIVAGTEKQLELKLALVEAEKALGRELEKTEREQVEAAVEGKQRSDDQLKQFNDLKTAAEKNATQIEDIYKNAAQSIQGAFSDFFFDVMQGDLSDLATSFKRTIDRMVADLLAAKLFQAVGGIGNGTAAGGGLSGLFGSLFGGISGRATGGPIAANTPYWVGEQGPEIVVPKASGTVIPADLSAAVASGQSGGESNTYQVTINAVDSKSFMDMIERDDRAIATALSQASQRYGIR